MIETKLHLPATMLATPQVARELGASEKTVRRYFREGRIRSVRVGKGYVTRREWLDEFLDRASGGNAVKG